MAARSAYNAAVRLSALLAALSRQTAPPELFEVIVVDDCLGDRTSSVAAEHGARVIRTPSRAAPTTPATLGFPRRGTVVAFTDADCVPADDWIERGLPRSRPRPVAWSRDGSTSTSASGPTLATLVDCARFLDQQPTSPTATGPPRTSGSTAR